MKMCILESIEKVLRELEVIIEYLDESTDLCSDSYIIEDMTLKSTTLVGLIRSTEFIELDIDISNPILDRIDYIIPLVYDIEML